MVWRARSDLTDAATTGPSHSKMAGIAKAARLAALCRPDDEDRVARFGCHDPPSHSADGQAS